MAIVETVRVVSRIAKQGYIVINKEDLTNRHELFKEKESEEEMPETLKRKRGMKKNEEK